jgi:hypothetical protein
MVAGLIPSESAIFVKMTTLASIAEWPAALLPHNHFAAPLPTTAAQLA